MDLLFFGLLWVIFLFAYGVIVEALQYPGAGADWRRLERIIYNPYWQMYNTIDSNIQQGKFLRTLLLMLWGLVSCIIMLTSI